MTKPGNSDPQEPSQPAEAPTEAQPTTESGPATEAEPTAETEPKPGAEPAAQAEATAETEPVAKNEPSDAEPAAGAEAAAEAESPTADAASSKEAEPAAASGEEAEPAAKAESAADGEPAAASTSEAGAEPAASAEGKPAEAEPAEAKPAAKASSAKTTKARRVRPVDAEPLMTDLEKAPPTPKSEALRAQAKRRFEEPPPRTLRFSFYFFAGSGLIWIVNAIQYLVFKQDIIDAQADLAPDLRATPDQINNSIWAMVVLAVTFTGFLGLFGYKATEGTRRARTLVTIFSSMLVIFHLLLNGSPLGLLSALLSLTALALLWSKSARAYFPPRQIP